jgi:hypothetical protein
MAGVPETLMKLESALTKQAESIGKLNSTLSTLGDEIEGFGGHNFNYQYAGGQQGGTPGLGGFSLLQGALGLGSTSPLGSFGSMGSSVGTAVSSFGPVGGFAGTLGIFTGELVKTIDSIEQWDRAIIDSKFKMGEFSPSMNVAKVEQRLRDIEYSMRMGEQLAGPTADLAEEYSGLREETSKWQEFFLKWGYRLTTGAERIMHFWNPQTFGENAFTTPEFIERWQRTGTGRGSAAERADKGYSAMRNEDFFRFFGRPARFPDERAGGMVAHGGGGEF